LKVHLILLIKIIRSKFDKTKNGQFSVFRALIRNLNFPYLVLGILRHIVDSLGSDVLVLGFELRVPRAVAADGLVLVKGLANRLP